MKALLRILPFLAVMTILVSCDKSKDKYALFGETKAYESWGWHEYTPQKMERYLDLEWNEASKNWLKDKPITIAVYTTDDYGDEIPAEDVKVYKNDVLCEGNSFTITTNETEVKFALEFKKSAKDGEHIYSLKYIPNGGEIEVLDEISFERFGDDNKMMADKETIMNPLKEKVIWATCIFLTVSILWYVLSRFVFWRKTPFSKVTITYENGSERTIRMKGGNSLVCTASTKTKDSFLAKLFKGSRPYEYHDFWTSPVTIGRGTRSNSISFTGARRYSINGERIRRSPIEIINENGEKATIKTT